MEVLTDDNEIARGVAGTVDIAVRYLEPDELCDADAGQTEIIIIDVPTDDAGLLSRPHVLKRIAYYDRHGVAVVSLGHAVRNVIRFRAVIDLYPANAIRSANYFEGPEYLILRPEFTPSPRISKTPRHRIFVAMGGSDPFDLTSTALHALAAAAHTGPIEVVLGAGYDGRESELLALGERRNLAVRCHRELDAAALADLMRSCTVAVTAFGTTSYEAMAVGIPVMCFTHYRWQQPSVELLRALGAVHYLGCAEERPTAENIGGDIRRQLTDRESLGAMGQRGPEIVDGRGAERVADLLQDFAAERDSRQLDCLYILAHPGDELLGCGGTILKQIRSGLRVGVLILGEGISSRHDGSEEPTDVLAMQQRMKSSLQSSMERLQIPVWYYCRFQDNRFDNHDLLDVVKYVETIIERHQPRVVYTHHPGDLNIDHRLTFDATVTAVRPVAGHPVRSLYSIEVPSSSDWGQSLGRATFIPNWYEDVGSVLSEKLDLLQEYATELREDLHPRSIAGVRARAEHWGRLSGMPAAEAFVLHRHIERE